MGAWEDPETFSRRIKILFCAWFLASLFLFGVGVYVVVHFVSKWW